MAVAHSHIFVMCVFGVVFDKCIQVCLWGHSHTGVMCVWCAVVGDVNRRALGLFAQSCSGSSFALHSRRAVYHNQTH